jgi:prepilin-type N-terminal cleavage/methylation domain-containing protein
MVGRGFTLIELMLALTLTLGIGLIGLQLFRQNEAVFQQQNAASETQQNVRAVASQISQEIRRAGQGLPVYATSFDASQQEAVAVILPGSDATHLRLRSGVSNAETSVTTIPAAYALNSTVSINVGDGSGFVATLGTTAPQGRFAYISASGVNGCWGWIRSELVSVGAAAFTIIPRQAGDGCLNGNTIQFGGTQSIALEEIISIYLNAGSVWRSAASDTTQPANPSWSPASELARNVTRLLYTYYTDTTPITLTSLSDRVRVTHIEVELGIGPYSVKLRPHIRNTGIH